MKRTIAFTIARFLVGSIYVVFGLNGFLQFIPLPAMTGKDAVFLQALIDSNYMFQLVKGLEVIFGLMLLSGQYLPFTLAALFPITLNIFLFHLLLSPSGIPIGIFLLSLHLYLALVLRNYFKTLFIQKIDLD
ncbi:MAG: hypothetical protein K2Q22_17995 [Cytophagales bacterium]|nr:hypothetical protein [Cytophagales bacterium]